MKSEDIGRLLGCIEACESNVKLTRKIIQIMTEALDRYTVGLNRMKETISNAKD